MFSFIEVRLFTKLVVDYLSDDEYAALQVALMRDPEAGPVNAGLVGSESFDGRRPDEASEVGTGRFTMCGTSTA
jgi:hypothetical protein